MKQRTGQVGDKLTSPADIEGERPSDAATRSVVRYSPLNAESPEAALASPVTPTAHTYVRSNFEVPRLDYSTHRIVGNGAIRAPGFSSMRDLARLPQRTVIATMECAGNDRTGIRPLPGGEPWNGGAISTTRWTGVPLHHVLDSLEPNENAAAVLAVGADYGAPADTTESLAFARAIPMDVALSPDTLLALTMNGEPLPLLHGGPVRLLVPGWYGMASVKWVARITVLTDEYAGYFQQQRYVYDDRDWHTPGDAHAREVADRGAERRERDAARRRHGLGMGLVWRWENLGGRGIDLGRRSMVRYECAAARIAARMVALGGDGPTSNSGTPRPPQSRAGFIRSRSARLARVESTRIRKQRHSAGHDSRCA